MSAIVAVIIFSLYQILTSSCSSIHVMKSYPQSEEQPHTKQFDLNTWGDKRKALITLHASLYGFLNELFFEVCHFNTNIFDAAIKNHRVSYKTCRLTSCVEHCICSLDNFLSERQPNSGSVLRKLH